MKAQINFDVSQEDAALIADIVDRIKVVNKQTGADYDPIDASMDLYATHANGCPLKLWELLEADNFNFAHDIFGIRRHLNRKTGKLEGFFLPRFAAKGDPK